MGPSHSGGYAGDPIEAGFHPRAKQPGMVVIAKKSSYEEVRTVSTTAFFVGIYRVA